jgi:hypothetical protein
MPENAAWKAQATTLRAAAAEKADPVARQTLLTLAEDCEAMAAETKMAGQPGKPKPPGNPPRPPDIEEKPPVREPPRPIPTPPIEPPQPPLSTGRCER